MSRKKSPIIEFCNVSKVFPDGTKAIENVDFQVFKGEITCLIGSSGGGKTTILRMVNRLEEPSTGKICIDGRCILEHDPISLRRSIGYAVQDAGLLPHLTVSENITLICHVSGIAEKKYRKRMRELLELVNLPPSDYEDRYPGQLSGGEQQRVGIARALMEDPEVLLMDEPFGALDPVTRKQLQQELIALNARLNKTILFVTHDIQEAFLLGNRILLMDSGRLVQNGSPNDLAESPSCGFVKEFIQSHQH